MTDCIPGADGRCCINCGWEWKRGGKFPRRNCPASETPEARARREAHVRTLPGYQLHRLIEWWTGEKITAGCPCPAHIAQMNAWGPTGCRENLNTIVAWLDEEATAREWRVHKWPGGRLGIRALVLLAIRRAERAGR